MKKVLSLVLVIAMMLAVLPIAKAQGSNEILLDGQWNFKYYANINDVPEDVNAIVFEDKIQVPGAMELQGNGYPSYYYEEMGGWGMPEDDGIRSAGVYKKEFSGNFEYTSLLRFENTEDKLTVYVNGEKIGESKNGAVGTVFEVAFKDGKNTLICVVERDNSGINKKDDFALSGIMGSVKITNSVTVEQSSKNVEVKNNTLVIDGEEVVLKGVKYTPTHPESGNAITNEQIDKDLELIKEYGFNAVWTSCAPEYFYEKAEKLELYVIDEANVNLSYADRDMETARKRVEEMIERHFGYKSIIMWSVGDGEGGQNLISAVKELDNRPVAQEVNFAPDFEVFGNTGGMADWVKTLGDGNVGGFVDEFADKELYYTKNAYDFTVTDAVTNEKVNIDGEISNYKGVDMLGKGSYTRNVPTLEEFTILTYISNANKDRVLFENDNIKLETIDYRIRLTVNGQSIDADGGEGKVAAVYADGEMQLFTSRSFKSNMICDAKLEGSYTVGEGNGNVGIEYVKIYDKILTIDELIEMTKEDCCISSVDFKDININKDNSYKFLAYGGDFGDATNSYYKCLTGLFTSTREPHPEAEAFKALFENEERGNLVIEWFGNATTEDFEKVVPEETEQGFVFARDGKTIVIDKEGRITSISKDGNELLTKPMSLTFTRENTLNEYEMGAQNEQRWRAVKTEVKNDGSLYVTYKSEDNEATAVVEYTMTIYGFMSVSVQAEFSDNAVKPTFIGFSGAGEFENAQWYGYEMSSYPDRQATGKADDFKKKISEMGDNYAVPQENGNKEAVDFALTGNNKVLAFKTASESDTLFVQALDYSPEAMEKADHDEDVEKDSNTYFRVGGFIKGLSDNNKYALNENVYGYKFFIGTDLLMKQVDFIDDIFVDGEELTAFAPHVKTYVYQTNKPVKVRAALQDDKKAVIDGYVIYFAPNTEYLSDVEFAEKTAEVAKDSDFNGANITMRGMDYWAPSVTYDKGITVKNGSVTYDVSNFTSHTFNAVIGKNDIDWRSMGGRFDRNMFQASSTVTIELDGVVVYEKNDVSMRSGSEEVNIDVSDASVMTITVTANGQANNYSDAVFANAAFIPQGPIVLNFEKKDGKAEITVLNTDRDYIDLVVTSSENGIVTTEMTRVAKGLYRTVTLDNVGENAVVKAYITGIGEVVSE